MASRANIPADTGSEPSPLQPWELRDQRFKASQALATEGSNSPATGSASSHSLQSNTDADSEDTEERAASKLTSLATRAVDPPLARPPSLNDKLIKKNNMLAQAKAEIAPLGALSRRGLAHEIKARMIEMFAQFQSVSQVGDAINSEFGLKLDRRTIEAFNPDSHRCRCGKRLISLFNLQREAYVQECAKVGVSHQAHRLRLIGTIVDKATTAKDFGNALKGLELAGKEMNAYSQEVKHTGVVSHVHGTVEEARRELADRLKVLVPVLVEPTVEPTVDSTATLVGPTDDGRSDTQPMRDATLVAPALPGDDETDDCGGEDSEASGDSNDSTGHDRMPNVQAQAGSEGCGDEALS